MLLKCCHPCTEAGKLEAELEKLQRQMLNTFVVG